MVELSPLWVNAIGTFVFLPIALLVKEIILDRFLVRFLHRLHPDTLRVKLQRSNSQSAGELATETAMADGTAVQTEDDDEDDDEDGHYWEDPGWFANYY